MAEATALSHKNASLDRKIDSLIALGRLEDRAIKSGLLPLTAEALGGAMFPEVLN